MAQWSRDASPCVIRSRVGWAKAEGLGRLQGLRWHSYAVQLPQLNAFGVKAAVFHVGRVLSARGGAVVVYPAAIVFL